MHLLSRYALDSSSKINKPFILPKFFPLSVEKYITFQPYSKYQSKNYDLWSDVIEIIYPELEKQGIKIVQIGAQNERQIPLTYSTVGQTTINQCAHIISNGILHLGTDSFGAHFASGFGKPIVAIYSNNYADVVKPYWTDEKNVVLIEPDRKGNKPSFSAEEQPKSINLIKPEQIAAGVFKLLEISNNYNYETFFIGGFYYNKFIELIPNQIVDPKQFNADSMVVRMDFLFNEDILTEQMKVCPCCIVTNQPISERVLNNFKPRIKELIYFIEKNHSPDFVKKVIRFGINTHLFCKFNDDEFRDIKLDYLDLPLITHTKPLENPIIEKIKSTGRKAYYSPNKKTLSDGSIYPSKAAWLENKEITPNNINEIIDTEEFWKELDYFKILLTKN